MNRYLIKAGEYLGTGLNRVYEPVCHKISEGMEAKTALIIGAGLELVGTGQLLHGAVLSPNSLEIILGSVFVLGGLPFLGTAATKYFQNRCNG